MFSSKKAVLAILVLLFSKDVTSGSYARRLAKPAALASAAAYCGNYGDSKLRYQNTNQILGQQKSLNYGRSFNGFDETPDTANPTLLNTRNEWGNTPLYYSNTPEETKVLVAAGADVNARDNMGKTALFIIENPEAIKALVEAGADVNARDKWGRNALFGKRNPETIKALIAAGADVNARDNMGKTALFEALYPKEVTILVEAGADVNARDKEGRTALFTHKSNEAIKALVAAGINVHARDKSGNTALHQYLFREEDIKTLVEAGLDVNAKNNYGLTPRDCILRTEENIDALEGPLKWNKIKSRINNGAYFIKGLVKKTSPDTVFKPSNEPDNDNPKLKNISYEPVDALIGKQKALNHGLSFNGFDETPDTKNSMVLNDTYRGLYLQDPSFINSPNDPEYIQALVKAGADVNARTFLGYTPLFAEHNPESIKALIAAGADVNARTLFGHTPLFFTENPESIKALVAAGADVNARDGYGNTPLFFTENPESIKALIAAGADVYAKNNAGKTVFDQYKNNYYATQALKNTWNWQRAKSKIKSYFNK